MQRTQTCEKENYPSSTKEKHIAIHLLIPKVSPAKSNTTDVTKNTCARVSVFSVAIVKAEIQNNPINKPWPFSGMFILLFNFSIQCKKRIIFNTERSFSENCNTMILFWAYENFIVQIKPVQIGSKMCLRNRGSCVIFKPFAEDLFFITSSNTSIT